MHSRGCGLDTFKLVKVNCHVVSSSIKMACLYFYLYFNNNQNQTRDILLRSLIGQLSDRSGDAQKELGQLLQSCKDGREQSSIQPLAQTLNITFAAVGHVKVVLDAGRVHNQTGLGLMDIAGSQIEEQLCADSGNEPQRA